MDFSEHDATVAELWRDYRADAKPAGTPHFHVRRAVAAARYGCNFRDYYHSAELQTRRSTGDREALREWCPQDAERGLPEEWVVSVADWVAERGVSRRHRTLPGERLRLGDPLGLSKAALLDRVRGTKPAGACRGALMGATQAWSTSRAPGVRGAAVRVAPICRARMACYIAAELRGLEQFCLDLVDDRSGRGVLAAVTRRWGRMWMWAELQEVGINLPERDRLGRPTTACSSSPSGPTQPVVTPSPVDVRPMTPAG